MLAERATPSLSELRELLRRQAPRSVVTGPPGQSLLSTGVEAVDRLIGGGLPRGKLTELCGARGAGRTALELALLGACTSGTAGRGEVAALVDVGGGLDVRRAEAAGVALERLLWVRPGEARVGLQAADILLGGGGFGLVVLDLGEGVPRLPEAGFLRLARAAERTQSALVLVATRPLLGTFSSLRLAATVGRAPRFLGGGGVGGGGVALDATVGECSRVLLGLEGRLAVERARNGNEGATVTLYFSLRGSPRGPG